MNTDKQDATMDCVQGVVFRWAGLVTVRSSSASYPIKIVFLFSVVETTGSFLKVTFTFVKRKTRLSLRTRVLNRLLKKYYYWSRHSSSTADQLTWITAGTIFHQLNIIESNITLKIFSSYALDYNLRNKQITLPKSDIVCIIIYILFQYVNCISYT